MGENSEIGKPDRLTTRLAQCFRDLRHQQGWSLDELTDRSGVSRATLSRMEHAEVSPTAQALGRIAGAYGMTVARLMRQAEDIAPELGLRANQTIRNDNVTGLEYRTICSPDGAYTAGLTEFSLPATTDGALLPDEKAGTEYTLVLLDGRLTVVQGGEEFVLRKGDNLRFYGEGNTLVRTTGKRGARWLLIAL